MQEVKMEVLPNQPSNVARYLNALIHQGYHVDTTLIVSTTPQYITIVVTVSKKELSPYA